MNTNIVKIILWGRTVGYVYWDKRSKRAVFQYDEDYVADGFDLAPLTMSLHGEGMRHNRVWLGDTDKLYLGLPPLLADSLPDHWGNSIFRYWPERGFR